VKKSEKKSVKTPVSFGWFQYHGNQGMLNDGRYTLLLPSGIEQRDIPFAMLRQIVKLVKVTRNVLMVDIC
jgi:hypothetical protein